MPVPEIPVRTKMRSRRAQGAALNSKPEVHIPPSTEDRVGNTVKAINDVAIPSASLDVDITKSSSNRSIGATEVVKNNDYDDNENEIIEKSEILANEATMTTKFEPGDDMLRDTTPDSSKIIETEPAPIIPDTPMAEDSNSEVPALEPASTKEVTTSPSPLYVLAESEDVEDSSIVLDDPEQQPHTEVEEIAPVVDYSLQRQAQITAEEITPIAGDIRNESQIEVKEVAAFDEDLPRQTQTDVEETTSNTGDIGEGSRVEAEESILIDETIREDAQAEAKETTSIAAGDENRSQLDTEETDSISEDVRGKSHIGGEESTTIDQNVLEQGQTEAKEATCVAKSLQEQSQIGVEETTPIVEDGLEQSQTEPGKHPAEKVETFHSSAVDDEDNSIISGEDGTEDLKLCDTKTEYHFIHQDEDETDMSSTSRGSETNTSASAAESSADLSVQSFSAGTVLDKASDNIAGGYMADISNLETTEVDPPHSDVTPDVIMMTRKNVSDNPVESDEPAESPNSDQVYESPVLSIQNSAPQLEQDVIESRECHEPQEEFSVADINRNGYVIDEAEIVNGNRLVMHSADSSPLMTPVEDRHFDHDALNIHDDEEARDSDYDQESDEEDSESMEQEQYEDDNFDESAYDRVDVLSSIEELDEDEDGEQTFLANHSSKVDHGQAEIHEFEKSTPPEDLPMDAVNLQSAEEQGHNLISAPRELESEEREATPTPSDHTVVADYNGPLPQSRAPIPAAAAELACSPAADRFEASLENLVVSRDRLSDLDESTQQENDIGNVSLDPFENSEVPVIASLGDRAQTEASPLQEISFESIAITQAIVPSLGSPENSGENVNRDALNGDLTSNSISQAAMDIPKEVGVDEVTEPMLNTETTISESRLTTESHQPKEIAVYDILSRDSDNTKIPVAASVLKTPSCASLTSHPPVGTNAGTVLDKEDDIDTEQDNGTHTSDSIVSDYLTAGERTDPNTEAFVTPLQSAGVISPPPFATNSFSENHLSIIDQKLGDEERSRSPFRENAATVNNQDYLFDDDDDEVVDEVVVDEVDDHSDYETSAQIEAAQAMDDPDQGGYGTEQILEELQRPSDMQTMSIPENSGNLVNSVTRVVPRQSPWQSSNEYSEEPPVLLRAIPEAPHLTPQRNPMFIRPVETSPLSLRSHVLETPARGLAHSRHNPERPQTPPQQISAEVPELEMEFEAQSFIPRDVTNIPWHARNDSIPRSLHSQSTISSPSSSPIHSALPIDNHEPVIRDSWPARPRNDSQLTDSANIYNGNDFDPFRFEGGSKDLPDQSGNSSATSANSHKPSLSGSSSSLLFQKMRNIFENNSTATQDSEASSPVKSRPVSGIFHPVRLVRQPPTDDNAARKGGYLNEAEDDQDEHSALLQSSNGGLDAN
jgi:hypothetical protein